METHPFPFRQPLLLTVYFCTDNLKPWIRFTESEVKLLTFAEPPIVLTWNPLTLPHCIWHQIKTSPGSDCEISQIIFSAGGRQEASARRCYFFRDGSYVRYTPKSKITGQPWGYLLKTWKHARAPRQGFCFRRLISSRHVNGSLKKENSSQGGEWDRMSVTFNKSSWAGICIGGDVAKRFPQI